MLERIELKVRGCKVCNLTGCETAEAGRGVRCVTSARAGRGRGWSRGKSGGGAGIVDRYNLNWIVQVIWIRLEGHA